MGKITGAVAACIAGVIVAAVAFAGLARTGALTLGEDALRQKYMLPSSHIVLIDDEPIHYSDEGPDTGKQGTPIVLVHGSLGSLRMWNDWAAALKNRYRIVRFDRPPAGLSGPDPQNRYDVDREVAIIDGLVTALQFDQFFLVGTSSGGASATQYAAAHPERIKGVVLSNIAVGPLKADPNRNPWIVRESRALAPFLNGWQPRIAWRGVLERNIVDHSKITDALVTEWTDFNNRPAAFQASHAPRGSAVPFARTPGDLQKIAAPALVLWSAEDSEIPAAPTADQAMSNLASADKTLVIIPHCEHMMPLDCGPESAAAAAAFFDRVSAASVPQILAP